MVKLLFSLWKLHQSWGRMGPEWHLLSQIAHDILNPGQLAVEMDLLASTHTINSSFITFWRICYLQEPCVFHLLLSSPNPTQVSGRICHGSILIFDLYCILLVGGSLVLNCSQHVERHSWWAPMAKSWAFLGLPSLH